MAIKYFVGANNGTWNTATNWNENFSGSGITGVPVAGDEVYLSRNITATTNVNANVNIGNISKLVVQDVSSSYFRWYLAGTAAGTPSTTTWTLTSPLEISIPYSASVTSSNTVDATIQVPMSGSGKITKTGLGNLYFDSAASRANFFGGFDVNEGYLGIGASNALGTGPIALANGTGLFCGTSVGTDLASTGLSISNPITINGDVKIGGLNYQSNNGTLILYGTASIPGTTRRTITVDSYDPAVAGEAGAWMANISSSVGFIKNGIGGLNLYNQQNNLYGDIYVYKGYLNLGWDDYGVASINTVDAIPNINNIYITASETGSFGITSGSTSVNLIVQNATINKNYNVYMQSSGSYRANFNLGAYSSTGVNFYNHTGLITGSGDMTVYGYNVGLAGNKTSVVRTAYLPSGTLTLSTNGGSTNQRTAVWQYAGGNNVFSTDIDVYSSPGTVAADNFHKIENVSPTNSTFITSGGIDTLTGGSSITYTLTINALSGGFTFLGPTRNTVGALSLYKTGTYPLILAGIGSHTADTRINAGTLDIQNSLALQSSSVNLATGDTGQLTFTGINSATFGSIFGTRNLALTNSAGQPLQLLNIGGDNSTQTYTGIMSGSTTDIYKLGTGTLTLASGQLFRNIPSIVGGITVSADSALGTNTTSSISFINGTLTNNSSAFITNRSFDFLNGTSNAINGPITINKSIIGGGNLSHTTGELILSGANNIGNVTIGTNSTVTTNNANALSGSGSVIFSADGARLNVYQNTTLNKTYNFVTSVYGYIGAYNGSTLVLTSGSGGTTSQTFIQQTQGVVETNTTTAYGGNYYIQPDAGTPVATTIFRDKTSDASGMAPGVIILSNGILELSASSISLPYSSGVRTSRTSDTNYSLANITLGQGFSSINPSGTTITTSLSFTWPPSTPATYWYGPLLFGTAYGTSTGKTILSGAMNLNAINQEFYVFNGATSSGSTAEIAGVIAGATSAGILTKTGPGKLILSGKNTYVGATNVSSGTLEVNYIGLQYGSGSSTVGGYIKVATGATYRYVGSGSQTYTALDLGNGGLAYNNTLLIDSVAGAYISSIAFSANTIISGAAGQNVICEVGTIGDSDMNLSGSNSWKVSGDNSSRIANTTAVSGSKLILSREDNACTLGTGATTIKAGAILETVTGEYQSGKAKYLGNLTLGTAGSGAVKAKYKIGNGPVKDAGATIVNGNLTFSATTNIQLNNPTVFNGPGEYIVFKYTGTCTGFENINATTNIAGRYVSHMRHDAILKRIYVTLS